MALKRFKFGEKTPPRLRCGVRCDEVLRNAPPSLLPSRVELLRKKMYVLHPFASRRWHGTESCTVCFTTALHSHLQCLRLADREAMNSSCEQRLQLGGAHNEDASLVADGERKVTAAAEEAVAAMLQSRTLMLYGF